jgi:Leucine-rich repeat (LRR) protein
MVIHAILDLSGNNSTPLTSVITTNVEGRVVELNLRGLNFPKGINFDIIRLSELQMLDIGSTNLSVMFPDIGTMVNLEVVRVDHNKLPFFSSTVGNLSKLKVLDLNNNDLTELPQSIINCQNLSKINVSGNRLCSLDSTMSTWIETLVPEWPINQRCQ